MATVATRLGLADHGRRIAYRDFLAGDYEEGYHYEIIKGRLYVSPLADPPENRVEQWLFVKVHSYSRKRPDIINYVTNKARIFVPGIRGITTPEPDLAAYRNFPVHLPVRQIRWEELNPLLAAEILSADAYKDLVRNPELFLMVPSTKEYWVVDIRSDPEQPSLRVHRRHGSRWRIAEVGFGETYTTRLLPGFELLIDPRK